LAQRDDTTELAVADLREPAALGVLVTVVLALAADDELASLDLDGDVVGRVDARQVEAGDEVLALAVDVHRCGLALGGCERQTARVADPDVGERGTVQGGDHDSSSGGWC